MAILRSDHIRAVTPLVRHSEGVRPLPYPFLGALSLSNDADYCSFELLEALMRFFNTARPTEFGTGLGLEITSSVFGYSPPNRQFAYFSGIEPSAPVSAIAPRLDEYLDSGWLDANHAYGDFDSIGGFQRAHAARMLEVLERRGIRLPAFINHGDKFNRQCVGAEASHHRGDLPGAPEYHTDLLARHGTTFLTSSQYATGVVTDPPPPVPISRGMLPSRRSPIARLFKRDRLAPLLEPITLRDGTSFTVFYRLRGTGVNAPNLSSLTYQILSLPLDALYEHAGVAVLYQHFGVLHRAAGQCEPATVESVRGQPHLFAGLRLLQREREEGRLWVAGLARLLMYARMIEATRLRRCAPGEFALEATVPVEDPQRFFQGLTIYIDPLQATRVAFKGQELRVRHNGPDETGRYSVSVPIVPLPDIW